MSRALNGSFEMLCFDSNVTIEIHDGLIIRFYTGLPHVIMYFSYIVCNSIFIHPEPSITSHNIIAKLLLPIAWAEQNRPIKFEQTADWSTVV